MAHAIRDYSALAYLNADFTGGELVFPDVDVVIIPKPGLLVSLVITKLCTQSQRFFLGKRYSLPVWFSVDSTKAMKV
jgi:hypothetical protein